MKTFLIISMLLLSQFSFSQKEDVQWLSFPELEKALSETPKKTLVHFYADWCAYCKKMEQVVYTKTAIHSELQDKYYAVKFNVESQDTIAFGGKTFLNNNIGKKRLAYHQIPEFLAGRPNQALELPAIVILDKNFNIEQRFYRYIPPKEMLSILKD